MHALLICLVTATVGIEVGWQRMPEGGMEYIIQLDPQTLESLGAGQAIQSSIPPTAGEVRSYRIIVGKQPLPREAPPPKTIDAKPPPPKPKESFPAVPQTLPAGSAGKLLPEQPAVYVESDNKPVGQPSPEASRKTPTSQPAKPWLPLMFTLLGLFASFGLNLFLGWIAWDSRRRVRAQGA